MAALAAPYKPRRPTESVLYGTVRRHLESFVAWARETYDRPLPRYVENELRAYLRCGVFAHGFVRCRCDNCGHELLVAFSCKARGICPSCAGRRMANTAAHLVDRVLPDVPVRQFVLSLPSDLRALAAFRADVLTAIARTFVEAIFASYRLGARSVGLESSEAGAVTFVQRFGGSLNLNVHLHVVVLDGVFVRDGEGRAVFHEAPPPSPSALEDIVARVERRIRSARWLRRHGVGTAPPLEDHSNEALTPSALEACAAIAMQRGTRLTLARERHGEAVREAEGEGEGEEALGSSDRSRLRAVERAGFNLHAGVRIEAGDDLGRERLCRYGARPALSLERLRLLPGNRVAYRMKYVGRDRAKHRVMSGIELCARLAALIPPPRYPLVRYHGVLAPRSSWRKEVVPRPRPSNAPAACAEGVVLIVTPSRAASSARVAV